MPKVTVHGGPSSRFDLPSVLPAPEPEPADAAGPVVDVTEGSVVGPRVVEGPAVVVAAGPSETEDAPKPRRVRRRAV